MGTHTKNKLSIKPNKTEASAPKKLKLALSKSEKKADGIARARSTLVFDKLIIENAYTFHGVNEIPLRDVGMVRVIGVNKDTKAWSSNGAGKSRMWNCMLRLIYGRKAMGKEKPSDIYNTETGNFRIELHFTKSGHTYIVRETKKHSKYEDGLHVFQDGKPFGIKNDPETLRKQVQALMNRSYEEFVGTIIWKQNNDHILLDGTPAERSKWVSDFFGLSVYDELFAVFSQKLDVVKSQVVGLAESKTRAKVLKESIDSIGDIDAAKSKAKRIRFRIESLSDVLEKNNAKIEKLRDKESDLKQIVELQSQLDDAGITSNSSAELASGIEELRTKIERTSENLRSAKQASGIVVEFKGAKKSRDKYFDRLVELSRNIPETKNVDVPDPKLLRVLLSKGQEAVVDTTVQLRKAKKDTDANKSVVEALAKLDDMMFADCSKEYLSDLLKTHRESLLEDEKFIAKNESVLEYETLLDRHVSVCPTCGSKVDIKKLSAKIEEAQEAMRDTKRNIKHHRREIELLEEGLRLLSITESGSRDVPDINKLEADLRLREAHQTALYEIIQVEGDYRKYKEAYSELLPKYKQAKALLDFDVDKAKRLLVKYNEKLEYLLGIKSVLDRYNKIIKQRGVEDTVDVEITKVQRERTDLADSNTEMSEAITEKKIKLDRIKGTIREYDNTCGELEKLQPELDKLKKLERKERIYKSLKKAYDKGGLKIKRLRELVDAIKTRLPIWTNILFTEKNFKIDTTGNEKQIGFEITQTKSSKDAKGKPVSKTKRYDASAASGSERTRISCALMLTMADVASSEKQCSLMVIDELERGLDPQSRQIMAEEVVQLLKHMKPSLFLITHSLDIDDANFDSEMKITKKNQQSTVKFTTTKRRSR